MGERHLLVASQPENEPTTQALYPDWEWNRQPFTLQDDTHPTDPHRSGQDYHILTKQLDTPRAESVLHSFLNPQDSAHRQEHSRHLTNMC